MSERYVVIAVDTGKEILERATPSEAQQWAKRLNKDYYRERFAGASGSRKYVAVIVNETAATAE